MQLPLLHVSPGLGHPRNLLIDENTYRQRVGIVKVRIPASPHGRHTFNDGLEWVI